MTPETFESLPFAAALTRAGVVLAANRAYGAIMGVAPASVVGRPVQTVISERLDPSDVDTIRRLATARAQGSAPDGAVWCRVRHADEGVRAVRIVWFSSPNDPALGYVFFLDDGGINEAKDAAEALARAGSELTSAGDEGEVLERAADALVARGFTVTFLLIEEGDSMLRYGPTRSPAKGTRKFEETPLPRTILTQLNPRFHEGRAVFLQHLQHTVEQAYAPDVARDIEAARPGRFVLQAPLFVSGEAYGAMVLTSDKLSPAIAGAAEIFAALVARAIEQVRMRSDIVAHERLAAIGEAAAVMAHEVRNPVGALLNAVALLRRGEADAGDLLTIIGDEARALERIVSDLLALGRPLTPRITPHDLRALVSRTIDVTRGRHPMATIRLHGGELSASVDPDLVQIAVYNVLRNSLEASPGDAAVDVFIEPAQTGPTIRVDDRGPAIPSALGRRTFEPYDTTRPAGTGIGLAAVRRVVEACGGRIDVGENEDGGGRVTLSYRE